MPYDERPAELPLDVEECRTALWRCKGNISEAAQMLKVVPSRLRSFVNKSPMLSREQDEARQQLADKAESIVYDALHDDDTSRQDAMAKYVLDRIGRQRGYAAAGNNGVVINSPKGPIIFSWADGTNVAGDDAKTIEGEVVAG